MPGSQVLLIRLGLLVAVVAAAGLVLALVLRWVRRRRGGRPGPPIVTGAAAVLFVVGAAVALLNRPSQFFVPEFPALPRLLPEDAFVYRQVDALPAAAGSDQQIEAIGDLPLFAGASSQVYEGIVWGMPFNLVDSETPRHRFSFYYEGASDLGEYPVTEPAYVQSMPSNGIDDHYIGVDLEHRTMWEVQTIRNWFGHWSGTAGARWELDELRYPKGSTTASGLPVLPGVYTWAEVSSGRIDHVLYLGSPVIGRDRWIWPARSTDGRSTDPDAPLMGSWLRLKSDADLSGLGPQATVIATALQRHGGVIGDTAGLFGLAGTPDARWDDADLRTLATLRSSDFEVVDASRMMVAADSMAALPAGSLGEPGS